MRTVLAQQPATPGLEVDIGIDRDGGAWYVSPT
jgi:hypothetical protein